MFVAEIIVDFERIVKWNNQYMFTFWTCRIAFNVNYGGVTF